MPYLVWLYEIFHPNLQKVDLLGVYLGNFDYSFIQSVEIEMSDS